MNSRSLAELQAHLRTQFNCVTCADDELGQQRIMATAIYDHCHDASQAVVMAKARLHLLEGSTQRANGLSNTKEREALEVLNKAQLDVTQEVLKFFEVYECRQ